MMKDYMMIDEVPADELCAQVGRPNYYQLAMIEIKVHQNQLLRQHGPPPEGSYFKIAENSHDAGIYFTLNFYFEDENHEHIRYAMEIEESSPVWDTESIVELLRLNPRYFELVKESNSVKSPKLNAVLDLARSILKSA